MPNAQSSQSLPRNVQRQMQQSPLSDPAPILSLSRDGSRVKTRVAMRWLVHGRNFNRATRQISSSQQLEALFTLQQPTRQDLPQIKNKLESAQVARALYFGHCPRSLDLAANMPYIFPLASAIKWPRGTHELSQLSGHPSHRWQ